MKRFVILFVMAMSMLSFTSCKDKTFAIDYSLELSGNGNGDVKVEFPQGSFNMDGTADLGLYVSNISDSLVVNDFPSNLNELVANPSLNEDLNAAALRVNDWVIDNISATTSGGSYYIHVKGLVKETLTGFTFEIDREFTNR